MPLAPAGQEPGDRLDSWKQIASYLGRCSRTVQRWEQTEKLPVYRLQHEKRGSVYAFKTELDAWREERRLRSDSGQPEEAMDAPQPPEARPAHPRWQIAAVAGGLGVLLAVAAAFASR